MTGAAMALGLARQGYAVAVIDPNIPAPFDPADEPDIRVSAISVASQTLLEKLGAWKYLSEMRVCPYRRLSVWEGDAQTDFRADDIGATHLGHIIENRLIQRALYEALQEYPQVSWLTTELSCVAETDGITVTTKDGNHLIASLLIGADGAQSAVRREVGIGTSGWQYKQQAFAVGVKTHAPQQDITWQCFVPTGPMAFLPLYDGYASLVWYHHPEHINQLKQLDDEALKQRICEAFPSQLVDFDILSRAAFGLTRMHANAYFRGRSVLIGDAAHTINPLAGQGLNLGFKDVACLLEELEPIAWKDDDDALQRALRHYQRKRKPDNLLMMSAMDAIYKTFSNDILPARLARNLILNLAQRSGPVKDKVMKYAMGL